jgi:hypothetical protein
MNLGGHRRKQSWLVLRDCPNIYLVRIALNFQIVKHVCYHYNTLKFTPEPSLCILLRTDFCIGTIHESKVKLSLLTGHEGPQGCETLRLPHFLDIWLTDGKALSLTCRLPFTPWEDSCYLFLLEAESTPGAIVQLEGLGKLKNSSDIRNQTCDLLACSIVPQPTTLLRAPDSIHEYF